MPQAPPGPIYPPEDDVTLEGLVDVAEAVPGVRVDLKYRGPDNFTGRDVYGGLRRCFLAPAAAAKLKQAHDALVRERPGLTFLVWDGARPERAQRILFDFVRGTPQEIYVMDPDSETGSIHSYGCAVDLGLFDEERGVELDMGTVFDHFGEEAEPRHELEQFRAGTLSPEAWANRLLLREVMVRAGFGPISVEWWHFNAFSNAEVLARFKRIP